MDLWERGQHVGLVGDAEAEGAARKGRSAFSGKEEDEEASELRVVVASPADWMANSSPPLVCLLRTDGLPPSCSG